MSLYFFDIADGVTCPDAEGIDLPSLHAARLEAVRLLGGLMSEDPQAFLNDDEYYVTVRDANKLILFRLDFVLNDAPAMKTL